MDGATFDPTVTIIVAAIGSFGLIAGPVLVALINRAPKAQAVTVALDPDKVMPRAEYDGLLEQLARLDDENDRLSRENARLRDQLEVERLEHARLLAAKEAP